MIFSAGLGHTYSSKVGHNAGPLVKCFNDLLYTCHYLGYISACLICIFLVYTSYLTHRPIAEAKVAVIVVNLHLRRLTRR